MQGIDRAGEGGDVFEADSAELRETYDEKFAELYRRFKRLVEDE